MGNVLEIEDLTVEVGDRRVLLGVSLTLGQKETKAIFGPNGSGKTSLLMAIMGLPKYKVVGGRILFKGQDVTSMPTEERARLGIGISFQRPPVVRGVTLKDILLASPKLKGDEESALAMARRARLAEFLGRDVNQGFSGGEIKRAELLQLLAQRPDLVLLDEPESGVDLVNITFIGDMINELLDRRPRCQYSRSGLIITHTGNILDYIHADRGYVLVNGKISCEGNPRQILATIRAGGYEECARCLS
jgi:Fe-S cluster assembly ATP-binding protein